MLTCKQIAELATDHAEGHLDLRGGLRFKLHVAICRHCRAYVRQLAITAGALGRLPDPEVSPDLEDALLRRFDGWKASPEAAEERHASGASQVAFPVPLSIPSRRREEGGVRTWTAGPAVGSALAAFALLVAFASHRSPSTEDWAVALVLAVGAAALAALSSRFSLGVAVAAVFAALAAALARGGHGPLAFSAGLHCLATEIGAAACVAGAAWLAVRRSPSPRARNALAAAGAAGAVAADAALQVTCAASASLAHLLVFHVGGVVAVAAGAVLLSRALVKERAS
jgi:hypothetical protein